MACGCVAECGNLGKSVEKVMMNTSRLHIETISCADASCDSPITFYKRFTRSPCCFVLQAGEEFLLPSRKFRCFVKSAEQLNEYLYTSLRGQTCELQAITVVNAKPACVLLYPFA